MWGFIFLAMKW